MRSITKPPGYLSIHLYISLFVCPSVRMFVCLYLSCLLIYQSLPIYLFTYLSIDWLFRSLWWVLKKQCEFNPLVEPTSWQAACSFMMKNCGDCRLFCDNIHIYIYIHMILPGYSIVSPCLFSWSIFLVVCLSRGNFKAPIKQESFWVLSPSSLCRKIGLDIFGDWAPTQCWQFKKCWNLNYVWVDMMTLD